MRVLRDRDFLYLVFMFAFVAIFSFVYLSVGRVIKTDLDVSCGSRVGSLLVVSAPTCPFEQIDSLSYAGVTLEEKRVLPDKNIYLFRVIAKDVSISILYNREIKHRKSVQLHFESWKDDNSDGFPDELVLKGEDSYIFRSWFVNIALCQSLQLSPNWRENQRDCAGLVRFAMKEALKHHNKKWFQETGIDPEIWLEKTGVDLRSIPDVSAYNYPEAPVGGTNIFVVGRDRLSSFATAYAILKYNVNFVGFDLSAALPGDLLFFHHPNPVTFHTMIYTGEGLVYHTGPVSEEDPGKIKLWRLDDYMRIMPIQWLPIRENTCFLGIYRLKILGEGEIR